jgi:hypothetical protein
VQRSFGVALVDPSRSDGATLEWKKVSSRLALALGESEKNFQVRFHAYVSGDPSVRIQGTPPPRCAIPQALANEPFTFILAAAASALRVRSTDVQKRGPLRGLFVHLAYRHGWRHPRLLAEICRLKIRAVHHIMELPPPPEMRAADLCLGDVRLRTPPTPS